MRRVPAATIANIFIVSPTLGCLLTVAVCKTPTDAYTARLPIAVGRQ
jgi:hypothetical protein